MQKMLKLFDTHAHYTDERINNNELISEIFNGDIGYITCVASNIDDSRACISKAHEFDKMFATVGIHPHECEHSTDISSDMAEIKALSSDKNVVAIGEIGLDYHYDKEWEARQKEYFDAQLSLAEELDLPVVIHDREAHGDVFDIIKAHKNSRGIIHSCSESAEMVRQYVSLGWYISFSGVITFKNASKLLDAVAATPLDRILVETDCPYLAPVPMRGKDNTSAYLHFTAEKAAQILGISYEEFANAEVENALRVFGIGNK